MRSPSFGAADRKSVSSTHARKLSEIKAGKTEHQYREFSEPLVTVTLDAKASALVRWYSSTFGREPGDVVNGAIAGQVQKIRKEFEKGERADRAKASERQTAKAFIRRIAVCRRENAEEERSLQRCTLETFGNVAEGRENPASPAEPAPVTNSVPPQDASEAALEILQTMLDETESVRLLEALAVVMPLVGQPRNVVTFK